MKFDEKDNFPAHNQGVPGSSPGGPTCNGVKNERVTELSFCDSFLFWESCTVLAQFSILNEMLSGNLYFGRKYKLTVITSFGFYTFEGE